MAEFGRVETVTLKAAADLSGKQYHAVRMSAANACNQASLSTDSAIVGVLQNKPQSTEAATVGYMGISKITVGGVVTAGDVLTSNSSGRAATVASGQIAIGRALETSTQNGDVITAILQSPVRWAGAP